MTFESLKELAKKAYSTNNIKALKTYVDEYIDYFKCIYPEIMGYINISYQNLYDFNFDNEEDFIRYIINEYDISPLELLHLTEREIINNYINSKLYKNDNL